ncbi:asparagine synthase [Microbacterium sp. NPDC076911]|uniref:asparagine synthase n=1 Tax=Microbacterium sp. NPDC076911 TaxID=3154958 RepID=UPI003418C462
MGKTADAIAEGVAIAYAAAKLAIRNRILVGTIARGEDFDAARFASFAQETLNHLAEEQEEAAELARRQVKRAWGKFSDSGGTHDYRDRDTRNLRKRRKQYRGVAKQLRLQAQDPHAVRVLVEQSRDAAWGDVAANLERRLNVEGMRPDLDPNYQMMRNARMQSLRLVDLPKLAAHRRHLKEGESADASDQGPIESAPAPRRAGVDLSELDA